MTTEAAQGAGDVILDTSSLLVESDYSWLQQLGLDVPDDEAEREALFEDLQQLAKIGSQHMSHMPPEQKTTILEAREDFFALLSIPDEVIGKQQEYNASLTPLGTFIHNFRQLHENGVDVRTAVIPSVRLFDRSSDGIGENIEAMRLLGINPADLKHSAINCLALRPETLRQRIETIERCGLSNTKVIDQQPNIINFSPERLLSKYQTLLSLGYSSEQVNSRLRLLLISEKTLRQRADYLQTLGVDPIRIGQIAPNILTVSVATLEIRKANLENVGFDAAKIISYFPAVLAVNEQRLAATMGYMEQVGVRDVVKTLSRNISLISHSIEGLKSRVEFFQSKDINPAKAIERNPRLLGMDIAVLTERYDHFMSLGIPATTLQMSPEILAYRSEMVNEKMDQMAAKGLDAKKLVSSSPLLLGADPEKIGRNYRIIKATLRGYGMLNYVDSAKATVEAVPSLLAASPNKLRIIGRIAAGFTHQLRTQPSINTAARRLDRMQIDTLVANHHLNSDINSIDSLRRAMHATQLNKDEAREIIAQVSQPYSSILKLHRRQYI